MEKVWNRAPTPAARRGAETTTPIPGIPGIGARNG